MQMRYELQEEAAGGGLEPSELIRNASDGIGGGSDGGGRRGDVDGAAACELLEFGHVGDAPFDSAVLHTRAQNVRRLLCRRPVLLPRAPVSTCEHGAATVRAA